MLYITSLECVHHIIECLYPWTKVSLFSIPSSPWQPLSTLFFFWVWLFFSLEKNFIVKVFLGRMTCLDVWRECYTYRLKNMKFPFFIGNYEPNCAINAKLDIGNCIYGNMTNDGCLIQIMRSWNSQKGHQLSLKEKMHQIFERGSLIHAKE